MGKKEQFREELEEKLDDQFPKNNQANPTKPSNNHRGEALILFSWAMVFFEKYTKPPIENKLDRKEKQLLIALVETHKESLNFLRGFAKPTKEEQDKSAYFNKIINKLK